LGLRGGLILGGAEACEKGEQKECRAHGIAEIRRSVRLVHAKSEPAGLLRLSNMFSFPGPWERGL
jgi:hypothetical protein